MWHDIGKKLGSVTPVRAKKLAGIYKQKKSLAEQAETEWEKKLILRTNGTGVVKCLRNLGLSNSPDKIMKLGVKKLLSYQNISKRNIKIIASLLQESGLLKDDKEWFFEDNSRRLLIALISVNKNNKIKQMNIF